MPVVITGAATDTGKSVAVWEKNTPTVTASGAAAGYPALNAFDPATWSSWKGDSGTSNWIQYDFGAAVSIDAVGIAAHTMASVAVSGLTVQYSADGVNWTDAVTYAPLTDDDLLFLFPSVSARYWRLLITGPAANIGYLVFGAKLAFPHTPIDSYTPLHHARRYKKYFNDSLGGVMLNNRVQSVGAETDVDFGFVERTFVDTELRLFESHYNQGGTFFYAGWPAGQVLDMGYCRAPNESDIVNVEYIAGENLANLSFGVHSYVG